MAVSKIEIFKTELTPDKNAKIDDIDVFLNNPEYSTQTYFSASYQYQRVNLELDFNISAKQEDFNGASIGNYLKLIQDGRVYYYFILSCSWTSINSCKLHCSIDTINTFVDELQWSDKTNILREHANRYYRSFGGFISETTQLKYRPSPTIMATIINIPQLENQIIENYQAFYTPLRGTGTLKSFEITYFDKEKGDITCNIQLDNASEDEFGEFKMDFVCKTSIRRKIDLVPEGLSPQLFGRDAGTVYEDNDIDSWYLIYNSKGEGEPVDTYLCKDKPLTTLTSVGESNLAVIKPNDLEENKYYFIDPFNGTAKGVTKPFEEFWLRGDLNPQAIIGDNNEEILKTSYKEQNIGAGYVVYGGTVTCFVFSKSGGFIQTGKMEFTWDNPEGTPYTVYTKLSNTASITVKSNAVFNIYKSSHAPQSTKNDMLQYSSYTNSPKFAYSTDKKVATYISDFSTLDRSKGTLIKVIKLPYCPLKHTIDAEGQYVFELNIEKSDTQTTLGGTYIRIPNNVKFGNTITANVQNVLKPLIEDLPYTPRPTDLKEMRYESKLYNSEFYQPKFVYDSFGFSFDLEKVTKDATISDNLIMEYQPSRMFNSAALYTFPEYITNGKDLEDFNNILVTNRNSEMPIYSNGYLNYIRNGYNYDVKVKDRNFQWGLGTALVNTAVNAAGAIVGLNKAGVFSRHTGPYIHDITGANPSKKIYLNDAGSENLLSSLVTSGAIRGTISGAENIAGVFKQKKDAEMAIEQKKKVLADQATSVSTCDSVDLLQAYAKNKAKIKIYQPSEITKEALFDLFYYNGYARNVKRLPDTTSRYWFNYIQCEPVFKGKNLVTYNTFIEDIKARYNEGVTVYHNHNGKYDINQEKENWEVNMIDY